jgi:hypothetical protein
MVPRKGGIGDPEYIRFIDNGYAWYFGGEIETPLHLLVKRRRIIELLIGENEQ